MAVPSLSVTVKSVNTQLDKLLLYKREAETLESKYQHIISEMIMLRLFSVFEDAVSELAFRLVAGGDYLNGAKPHLMVRARRQDESRGLMLNFGRVKPVANLRWTKAQYIRESVEHVIPIQEKFVVNAQAHGQVIDEMRRVRNALAHNTPNARSEYRVVVRHVYGANVSIPVGAFLTTNRRVNPCNIDRYLGSVRAIVTSLASGV